MSFRQSFSRFRKKAKDKVSNIGNRMKGRGTSVGGEGPDRSSVSLRSETVIAVEGEPRGDTGVSAGNDDPRPGDSPSVSQSMAELDREPGGSDHTAQRERGKMGLHPHAHECAGRGSSQERGGSGRNRAGQVDPPRSEPDVGRRTPTPSILQDSESESTRTTPFQSPPLTNDAANPTVPGPVRVGTTTSRDKSEWIHTASSAAKLFLRTVERASDAFPPLKSVAGGLCAILDNCEVWSAIVRLIRDAYGFPSKRRSTNKQ